jgi:hypothetical protein
MMRAAAVICTYKELHRVTHHVGGPRNSTKENEMDFLTTIQGLDWTTLVEIGLQLVGTFALIATMTKNTSDNTIADFLYRAINTMGLNVGRAKNG